MTGKLNDNHENDSGNRDIYDEQNNARYMKYESVYEYDTNNVFAKIIKREMPCRLIYENECAMSFYDIKPVTPIHALVIPKGPYVSLTHFAFAATVKEQRMFFDAIANTIVLLGLELGYKTHTNTGPNGGQEVYHCHLHIMGGFVE